MTLNAELNSRLNATTLVNGFLASLAGPAGSLGAIESPVAPQQLADASASGNAFLPAQIQDAVARFSGVQIAPAQALPTLDKINAALTAIEQVTSRNMSADITELAQQLSRELEGTSEDGIPGILLRVANLLKDSPGGSALVELLTTVTGASSSLSLPPEIKGFLPALVSTARVIAGLMVFETVLGEGERLSGIVSAQFNADRARQELANVTASFQANGQPLSQLLSSVDINDAIRLEGAILSVESSARQLESLDEYLSQGMGLGEATLEYFDVARAQAEIAVAATLLRNADLSELRQLTEAAVKWIEPFTTALDPQGVARRGMEELLSLAESQVALAAAAIRGLDASIIVNPLTEGLNQITSPLREFSNLVAQLVVEIRAALEQVRSAVAALSVDDIAAGIRTALAPITQAMELLQNLVDEIRVALQTAAQTAIDALNQVEGKVDEFETEIRAFFEEAQQFVDALKLDQVIGEVSDKVNEFVGVLQQAQMKPYFDTVSSAIGTAADVISAVPLGLLPDSMKGDLDAALKPVRDVNAQQVETEIENLLQISPGGEFKLREDLEQALQQIQTKFDELMATLDRHHPRQFLEQIDGKLSELADKIETLSPDLALEPVQEAIAKLKSSLGAFDLEQELQPVQAIFDQALLALNQYSPATLLQPLEDRVRLARESLVQAIRLNEWRPAIEGLVDRVTGQLDLLDPERLEQQINEALKALQEELERLPDLSFGNWLGMIITSLMRGSNLRLAASSIEAVLGWLQGQSVATADLMARATTISDALARTKSEIESFDLASLSVSVTQNVNALKTAIAQLAARLPAGSGERLRLDAVVMRLEAETVIGRLTANRARYLALVATAAGLANSLRRTGMSEVDIAVNALREAFAPLNTVLAKARQLSSLLGLTGFEGGFRGVLIEVFKVASPERISQLAASLFAALKDRFGTIISEVLTPVSTAIDDLEELIALIDLQPVIDGANAVFQEIQQQIEAFSPLALLREQLDAFSGLKQDLLEFDPLESILDVLNTLRDTAARVLEKLSFERLLAAPLAIYDTILAALRQLSIDHLLAPLLETLDLIAKQVDEGLDETVAAFERLQEALPPPSGGGAGSPSVSVA